MILNPVVYKSGGGGAIALASIAITMPPTKTSYNAGESFDATGMVVLATYTNGATRTVTGYTISPAILSYGDTSVTVTFTEDGVSKTATQAVTVSKQTPTITPSSASVTLDANNLTATVILSSPSSGAFSASSSNTSVATVSVNGSTLTISSVNDTTGTATITISQAATVEYDAATATVSVTATFAGNVVAYTSPQTGVTYTNGISGLTDSELSEIAQAISNNSAIDTNTGEIWVSSYDRHISIGDQISYTMSGTSYAFRVMGFNHYALTSSTAYGSATATGKAGILMQMVDCFNTTHNMAASAASTNGWHNSDLRTWMNGTMLGYFTSSAQNAIKQVNIQTAENASTATLNTTADKLFVPAEVEIFGSATYAKGGTNEGTRYAWYAANDTSANRVKKVNGSASLWWERSPYNYSGTTSRFCRVNTSGNTNTGDAVTALGVAPCFCY